MIRNNKRIIMHIFFLGILIGVGLGFGLWADSPAHAEGLQNVLSIAPPLSEEVEELSTKGMTAAKIQEWDLAIKYLKEASSKAPYSPRTLYNLAIVYDKSGGRDLIALAWYQAYLTADPNAANAVKVRERIFELELATEARILKLADMARKATDEILSPYDDGSNFDRFWAYQDIAEVQAMAGDLTGAKKTASEAEENHDYAISRIAKVQLEAGDLPGAQQTVELFKDDQRKSYTLEEIARYQVKSGDLTGALQTAGMLTSPSYQSSIYGDIVEVLAKDGDMEKAEKLFSNITHELDKRSAAAAIAEGYIAKGNTSKAIFYAKQTDNFRLMTNAGDIAGALKTASQLDGWSVDSAYLDIASKQAEAGDLKGAKKTAKKITDSQRLGYANQNIARATSAMAVKKARAGHVAEAMKIVKNITDPEIQSDAYSSITYAQIEQGDLSAAIKTAKFESRGQAAKLLFIVQKYLEADDLASAEKLLSKIVITDIDGGSDDFSTNMLAINQNYAIFVTYKAMALAYLKAGKLSRAYETIEEMDDEDSRIEVYGELAAAQGVAGDFPGARETIKKISGTSADYWRSTGFRGIAQRQVTDENLEEAKATADELEPSHKMEIYRAIGAAQFKAGDLKGAQESMEVAIALAGEELNYHENYSLSKMYKNIAEAQTSIGKEEEAKQTLAELDQIKGSRETIDTFSKFADNLAGNFVDLESFVASRKDKIPKDTVQAILKRAKAMATKLNEAKEMAGKQEGK